MASYPLEEESRQRPRPRRICVGVFCLDDDDEDDDDAPPSVDVVV